MSQKFSCFFLLFAATLILLTLLFSFFQQDEWHSFGTIQSYGWRYITLDKPIWQLLFNDRIGARIVMFLQFWAFGVSGYWFGVFSGFVHIVNTFLVFLLAKKLFKKSPIAFLSSLFFLVNSVDHQSYSWFGTVAGSATSVTFILISLIFYFEFLQKRKRKFLFISVIFVYVSLLFKESGYFLFLLYPILWFLLTKKKTVASFVRENILIICYGIIMTVLFAISIIAIPGQRANYVSPTSSGTAKLLTHFFLYPTEGIIQVFLPPGIVFPFANLLTQFFVRSLSPDTPEFDLFYTTKMVEYVSLGISGLLGVIGVFLYKRIGRVERFRLPFLFSITFIILSFLPYTVLDKFDGYLDSRYYYPAAVGAALLLGTLVAASPGRSRQASPSRWATGLAFLFIAIHFSFLALDLFHNVEIGNERKKVLQEITSSVPKLYPKTVFFITGNSSGYYALSELQVPFQSGLGQVLMVLYAEKGQIDPDLFKEKTLLKTLDAGFLYDTLAQGYKETETQGFGYFYQIASLNQSLENKKFAKSDVVSLYYDSDAKTIKRLSDFE